ncbi:MAG: TolC family protein [Pirellulaceae bacterium]|nr:TolC family protein [Pirellulaceae bacterium]
MMPRSFCLFAALLCAGCVGNQKSVSLPNHLTLGQSGAADHLVSAKNKSNIRLTAHPAITTEGARLDDHLIEGGLGQPVLPIATDTPESPAGIVELPSPQAARETMLPDAGNVTQVNLPTALAMIGGQHPAVGFAQWRVKEAYAQLEQARVLWLPSIQAGLSYHRHDGNYQASDGRIVDINRGSLQYGLGTGATGAGTTPRPGIVAQFHLADAIFEPKIAQKRAWSQSHAAGAALNRQLMNAAVGYINLVSAYQEQSVLEASRGRTAELAKLTRDFAEAGQGLQADADRLQTELILMNNRVVASHERVDMESARMAEVLNTDPMGQLIPLDPTVVPIEMIDQGTHKPALISTGLSNRPELKQAGALVAAACDAYKRQKYAPLIPSVMLGFSNGGFAGGLGSTIDDDRNRYDFDAIVSWEVRQLGLGERASRRASNARVQQAKFEKIRLMDQVAREIAQAHTQVQHRRQQVEITRQAIQSAENSYQRNLDRIRDGQGLPLEVLQSIEALEDARLAYLNAVVDYNTSQFRLQWALGWPITANVAQ